MKIFDPHLAMKSKSEICSAIDSHLVDVIHGHACLEDFSLKEHGILLEPDDFSLHRCSRWTKRDPLRYRQEVIILSGLRRSICVRLMNKRRYWGVTPVQDVVGKIL